jgi:hypothetical protein
MWCTLKPNTQARVHVATAVALLAGAPLLINTLRALPKSVPFELDAATEVTVIFVMLSLAVNLAIVCVKGFTYPRWAAPVLFGLYSAYAIAQIIVQLV